MIKCEKCDGEMKMMSLEEYVKNFVLKGKKVSKKKLQITLLANLMFPKPYKCNKCGATSPFYSTIGKALVDVQPLEPAKGLVFYMKNKYKTPANKYKAKTLNENEKEIILTAAMESLKDKNKIKINKIKGYVELAFACCGTCANVLREPDGCKYCKKCVEGKEKICGHMTTYYASVSELGWCPKYKVDKK